MAQNNPPVSNVSKTKPFPDSWSEVMTVKEALDNGVYSYFCKITCEKAGSFGFTARVIPNGDDWM